MYSYKKDFFGQWKRKNNVSLADLSTVLGTSARDKIKMWAGEAELPEVKDGEKPQEDRGWLPLKHIIRLCNYYEDLKFSDFIENAEEPRQAKPVRRHQSKVGDDTLATVREAYETATAAMKETISTLKATIKSQEQTIRSHEQTIKALQDNLEAARASARSQKIRERDAVTDPIQPREG